MSIFTNPKREAAPLADPPVASRPELWVPADLARTFAEVAPVIRAGLSPLEAGAWFEDLSGGDIFAATAERRALGSPLARHVRLMLETTLYDGIRPGSVSRPHAERVREIVMAVLADRERAWDAHVHLHVLGVARREHEQRTQEQERERQRRAVAQCPVCQEHDTARIGPVLIRSLLAGQEFPYGAELPNTVRSCLACWHVACAEYGAMLATEKVAAGGTREVAVRRAVDLV